MAYGPQAGLEIVDKLLPDLSLRQYHLLPSVRGDLLFKLGRHAEARAEFERAAALTRNERERQMLLDRANDCAERR
jgi:predicted RNA polymerase sigma factor